MTTRGTAGRRSALRPDGRHARLAAHREGSAPDVTAPWRTWKSRNCSRSSASIARRAPALPRAAGAGWPPRWLLALGRRRLWLGPGARGAPTVRVAAARAAAEAAGRLGAGRQRLRHRPAPGHRLGEDHRQGDRGADRGGHAGQGGRGAGPARRHRGQGPARARAGAARRGARPGGRDPRPARASRAGATRQQEISTGRRRSRRRARSSPPRARSWPRSRRSSSRPSGTTRASRSSTSGSSSPRRRWTRRSPSATLRAGAAARAGPGGAEPWPWPSDTAQALDATRQRTRCRPTGGLG